MLKSLLVVLAAVVLVQVTHAQGTRYVRGDTVRLVARENGDPLPDSRIIAIAGDRVHIDKSSITVNDVAVQGASAELLQTVTEAWDQLVPQGHYFVVGESGPRDDRVRYYGLIPASKIIRKL
ncbi:MAG TPA: S26 family signal peptidase [Vicinamibacterales bacterium]